MTLTDIKVCLLCLILIDILFLILFVTQKGEINRNSHNVNYLKQQIDEIDDEGEDAPR